MSAPTVERPGSTEAARRRRELALAEIDRIYDGIRMWIIAQRDASWDAAVTASVDRIRAALTHVDIQPGGTLTGPMVAVHRARVALLEELTVTPQVLTEIQGDAELAWSDALRAREARRWAYAFGGAS